MKTIIEIAREAGGGLSCVAEPLEHPWKFTQDELKRFAALVRADAFEQGRQEGMKQERALWELSKLGQEIEAQPKIGCVQHDCAECVARLAQSKCPWVGLTDEEIKAMDAGLISNSSFYAGALWAEAKLKEKNT